MNRHIVGMSRNVEGSVAINFTCDPVSTFRNALRNIMPFDLIFANILKGPLIELAPDVAAHAASGGYVILSGLLVEQAEDVTAAYVANGLALAHREDIGEWSTLTLQK